MLSAFMKIRFPVRTVAEMLGYDPLYMACEGRVLAVIDAAYAETVMQNLHNSGYLDAAIIDRIETGYAHALIETVLGGERILQELEKDPFPYLLSQSALGHKY